jgi:CheY-like chemotaxis protein
MQNDELKTTSLSVHHSSFIIHRSRRRLMMHTGKANVLLIDDEEAHRLLISRLLLGSGWVSRVDAVCDGEQALDYLFHRGAYAGRDRAAPACPTFMLLDLKLPRIDGLQVLAEVKAHPVLCKIPVVVLTTSEHPQDVERAYRFHANSYITKPVSFKLFEEIIDRIGYYWSQINETVNSGQWTVDSEKQLTTDH